MKAISLTQPWATLVVVGAKQFETRSWRTNYRGPLAIHAAKGFPGWAQELCPDEPFRTVLQGLGYTNTDQIPVGKILGTVRLIECYRTTDMPVIGEQEQAFGNYEEGRWAWLLEDPVRFDEPIPATGARQLWEWSQA